MAEHGNNNWYISLTSFDSVYLAKSCVRKYKKYFNFLGLFTESSHPDFFPSVHSFVSQNRIHCVFNLYYTHWVWIKTQKHICVFHYEIIKSQFVRISRPVWSWFPLFAVLKLYVNLALLVGVFLLYCESWQCITPTWLLNVERLVGKNLNICSLAFSGSHLYFIIQN